jgi:hypothetical protein
MNNPSSNNLSTMIIKKEEEYFSMFRNQQFIKRSKFNLNYKNTPNNLLMRKGSSFDGSRIITNNLLVNLVLMKLKIIMITSSVLRL